MSEDSLEALITRCPNCDTRFRVSEAQLQVAAGRVRCGACLGLFDGVQHLLFDGEEFDPESCADVDKVLEELERLQDEEGALPEHEVDTPERAASEPHIDDTKQRVEDAEGVQDDDEESIPSDLAALEAAFIADLHGEQQATPEESLNDKPQTDDAGDDLSEPLVESLAGSVAEPEFVAGEDSADQEPAAGPGRADASVTLPGVFVDESGLLEESQSEKSSRSLAITLCIALLLLLGLPAQVLWYQYDAWVQDPQKRFVYVQICKVMDCRLPPLRDVRLITSKKSVIRIHPERGDARIVDVLMVNNASFAQPFPLIELRATSLRGQLIAGRRFKPAEYLQGELQPADLMPARTPVHVSLEIQDPGERAMNFEVRFR